jgi:hypothetical protein
MGLRRLPHDANGIKLDDYTVKLRNDKVMVFPRSGDKGDHYTLHTGPHSAVLDVHETLPEKDEHRTLFKIRHEDIGAVLGDTAPMAEGLLRLLRPLRLGWLKRHGICVVRGLDPASDDEIEAITVRRNGCLVIDDERLKANIFVPQYLDEVWGFPDGAFSLVHCGRKIGIGFKKTDSGGNARLFWIKLLHLKRFAAVWQPKIVDALSRSAITPGKSGESAT